jgi:anti-sigma-K factor RskA
MSGHPNYDEFFDLYALGVIEGVEYEEFRAHLASCEECARKLAEAQGRIASLSFALEPATPPAGAKERLMRRVRAESKENLARVPKAEPGARATWWTMVLAPVTLALAIATVYLWTSNDRLKEEIRGEDAQVQSLKHEVHEANELMELETAKDTVSVKMMPMKKEEPTRGQVLYNPRMGMAFYTDTLPPAPKNMTYQLWLVPMNGAPISAGTFGSGTAAGFHMMAHMPEGIEAKAFAVTMETAGGVPQPQGPKLLVGPVG